MAIIHQVALVRRNGSLLFEWVAEETVVNKVPLATMETQDEER